MPPLPDGAGRVILLRPGVTQGSRSDSPSVLVDGREVVRLAVESYSEVDLKAGTYVLSLKPNPGESGIWTGQWRITVEAGRRYFLSLRNVIDVARGSGGFIPPPPGSPAAQGVFVLFQLLLNPPVSQRESLKWERVDETEALASLSSFKHLAPLASALAPLPELIPAGSGAQPARSPEQAAREEAESAQPASPEDAFVNCAVAGARTWTYQSRCDP